MRKKRMLFTLRIPHRPRAILNYLLEEPEHIFNRILMKTGNHTRREDVFNALYFCNKYTYCDECLNENGVTCDGILDSYIEVLEEERLL